MNREMNRANIKNQLGKSREINRLKDRGINWEINKDINRETIEKINRNHQGNKQGNAQGKYAEYKQDNKRGHK